MDVPRQFRLGSRGNDSIDQVQDPRYSKIFPLSIGSLHGVGCAVRLWEFGEAIWRFEIIEQISKNGFWKWTFGREIVTLIVVNKTVLFDERNKSPSEGPCNPIFARKRYTVRDT